MYFSFYSHVYTTRGSKRSLLINSNTGKLVLISHAISEIFSALSIINVQEALSEYDDNSRKVIHSYLHDFVQDGFGYYSPSSVTPADRKNTWRTPQTITNAILEISDTISESLQSHLKSAISELNMLGCAIIELRMQGDIMNECIQDVLHFLVRKEFMLSIYCTQSFFDKMKSVLDISASAFFHIHICDNGAAGKNIIADNIHYADNVKMKSINKSCGTIDPSFFTTSGIAIEEGYKYNTCLNRKVSIDGNGNIKNCPSMQEIFGNIATTTFAEVLANPAFTKYWHIKKNDIDICKVCEFRNICTDCRAYLDNPNDIYSKPLKCGYDPHTCEWKEWSTNPLKQEAILHYGLEI